jgi:hypothetical protein
MQVGRDRNLAVHMYRGEIGQEIAEQLLAHSAVVRRWLEALQNEAGAPGS